MLSSTEFKARDLVKLPIYPPRKSWVDRLPAFILFWLRTNWCFPSPSHGKLKAKVVQVVGKIFDFTEREDWELRSFYLRSLFEMSCDIADMEAESVKEMVSTQSYAFGGSYEPGSEGWN